MLHYRQEHTATVCKRPDVGNRRSHDRHSGSTDIPVRPTRGTLRPNIECLDLHRIHEQSTLSDTASLLGNGTVLVAGGNDGDTCTCTTF